MLRPLDGTSEYLLLMPGNKESDLGKQSAFVSRLLEQVTQAAKSPLVVRIRTESASFRPELSNLPGGK